MGQEIQLNEQEYPPTYTADFNPTLNDIIIYQTEDGEIKLDVKLDKETVWLTQVQMGELFQKDRTVIGRHINNIYKEGELKNISHVQNLHMWVLMVTKNMRLHFTTLMLSYPLVTV